MGRTYWICRGIASAILLAALLQCYASRTKSGCSVLDYCPLDECRARAKEYNRTDIRALTKIGYPAVVHYQCVEVR